MVAADRSDPPTVAVVVWATKTTTTPTLRADLVTLATRPPDESTEYQGMVDFHWWFDDAEEGAQLAATLNAAVGAHPDVMVLRLSNYADSAASVTYKDLRDVRH